MLLVSLSLKLNCNSNSIFSMNLYTRSPRYSGGLSLISRRLTKIVCLFSFSPSKTLTTMLYVLRVSRSRGNAVLTSPVIGSITKLPSASSSSSNVNVLNGGASMSIAVTTMTSSPPLSSSTSAKLDEVNTGAWSFSLITFTVTISESFNFGEPLSVAITLKE